MPDESDDHVEPRPVQRIDAPLVPEYFAQEAGEWVTVRSMGFLEASLAQAKLESEGIRSVITDEHFAALYSNVLGSARLRVMREDVEAANEVLSRVTLGGSGGDEDDYVEEDWRCPKCHVKNVRLLALPWWSYVLTAPVMFVPLLWLRRRRRCEACGHEWMR